MPLDPRVYPPAAAPAPPLPTVIGYAPAAMFVEVPDRRPPAPPPPPCADPPPPPPATTRYSTVAAWPIAQLHISKASSHLMTRSRWHRSVLVRSLQRAQRARRPSWAGVLALAGRWVVVIAPPSTRTAARHGCRPRSGRSGAAAASSRAGSQPVTRVRSTNMVWMLPRPLPGPTCEKRRRAPLFCQGCPRTAGI